MKKQHFFSLLAVVLFLPLPASAQLYTGGSVGLSFTNSRTYLSASPVIGYRMNDLRFGIGGILSHESRDDDSWTYYGARLFSQYDLFQGVFLHAEIEALNVQYSTSSGSKTRDWVMAVPVGGGYSQRIGDGIYASAMILFDLIQESNSPYDNPIIRGGLRYHF